MYSVMPPPTPTRLPTSVDDTIAEAFDKVKRDEMPGMYLIARGAWLFTQTTGWIRHPVRLASHAHAHPARLYVESWRDHLPVNEAAKELFGIEVRGPVCVMAPATPI